MAGNFLWKPSICQLNSKHPLYNGLKVAIPAGSNGIGGIGTIDTLTPPYQIQADGVIESRIRQCGELGDCYLTNGDAGHRLVTSPTITTSLTMTALLYASDVAATQYGPGKCRNIATVGQVGYHIGIWNSNNIGFRTRLNNINKTAELPAIAKQIYCATATYDGSNMYFWLDSVKSGATGATGNLIDTQPFVIAGRYTDATTNSLYDNIWRGNIYDIRVWDRVLSDKEIIDQSNPERYWDLYKVSNVMFSMYTGKSASATGNWPLLQMKNELAYPTGSSGLR